MLKWYKSKSDTVQKAIIGSVVTIITAMITTCISIVPGLINQAKNIEDSSLKLVDTVINDELENPEIDIKVRNTGNDVAFLKQATIYVEKKWKVLVQKPGSGVSLSATYDIEIPPSSTPYTISTIISQEIQPNAVDRFSLRITGAPEDVLLVHLSLLYDEDNKSVNSEPMVFVAGLLSNPASYYGDGGKILSYNKAIISELKQIKARKSASLLKLMGIIDNSTLKPSGSPSP